MSPQVVEPYALESYNRKRFGPYVVAFYPLDHSRLKFKPIQENKRDKWKV